MEKLLNVLIFSNEKPQLKQDMVLGFGWTRYSWANVKEDEFLDLFKLKEFIEEGAQDDSNVFFKAFQKQFCHKLVVGATYVMFKGVRHEQWPTRNENKLWHLENTGVAAWQNEPPPCLDKHLSNVASLV